MLTELANKTGGKYFRARDTQALQNIYSEIDELETSEVEEVIYLDKKEHYPRYLLFGFLALIAGMASERFIFRSDLA
jgi:Ca-activated chloride channel family protein